MSKNDDELNDAPSVASITKEDLAEDQNKMLYVEPAEDEAPRQHITDRETAGGNMAVEGALAPPSVGGSIDHKGAVGNQS
jgi:hypothetical protein